MRKVPQDFFGFVIRTIFSQYRLEFQDPLEGLGGFGASSAQFALLHGLYQLQGQLDVEAERFFDWHSLLKDYRSLHSDGGTPPSGADVVSQCRGGLLIFLEMTGSFRGMRGRFLMWKFCCSTQDKSLRPMSILKIYTCKILRPSKVRCFLCRKTYHFSIGMAFLRRGKCFLFTLRQLALWITGHC